ncbi:MAG: DUF4367 domain-containing protein [Oscillospiraceae bacterium]|nr:DUF4367 domain-containing protein [Oscillospiraceae bacterium]
MFTDEMLRKAAEESCLAYTESIIAGLEESEKHVFSKKFERKIEKIKRNIGRPKWHRPLQRIACAFLAIVLGASVWLGVNAEARTKVMGWVKDIYGGKYIFHFTGEANATGTEKIYRPTWMPEGYGEYKTEADATTTLHVYSNAEGKLIKVAYSYEPDGTYWFIDIRGNEKVTAYVNGRPADLYISCDPQSASKIIWVDSNGTAFYVSAFLDKKDLIKIAKNIREIDKK